MPHASASVQAARCKTWEELHDPGASVGSMMGEAKLEHCSGQWQTCPELPLLAMARLKCATSPE